LIGFGLSSLPGLPFWEATDDTREEAKAAAHPQSRRCQRFFFGAAGDEDHTATHQEGKRMRNRKAAGVDADVLVRIAQIEQMTLDQIAAFQCRILTEITTGRIAPREASAIDRALRKRLNAIERELREGG
jgi:hypothetical protein